MKSNQQRSRVHRLAVGGGGEEEPTVKRRERMCVGVGVPPHYGVPSFPFFFFFTSLLLAPVACRQVSLWGCGWQ